MSQPGHISLVEWPALGLSIERVISPVGMDVVRAGGMFPEHDDDQHRWWWMQIVAGDRLPWFMWLETDQGSVLLFTIYMLPGLESGFVKFHVPHSQRDERYPLPSDQVLHALSWFLLEYLGLDEGDIAEGIFALARRFSGWRPYRPFLPAPVVHVDDSMSHLLGETHIARLPHAEFMKAIGEWS